MLVLGRLSGRCPTLTSYRADRRLKEKDMQIEEERNRAQRAEDQVNRLNTKTKTLRRQVDDAVSPSSPYRSISNHERACV